MIEINLTKLDRGTKKEWKTVTRGGKTFKQRFATGEKDKEQTPDKTESFKDIKDYPNAFEFMRKNVEELKKHGVKDREGWEKIYNETRMERFTPKEVSKDAALDGIRSGISASVQEGWFRAADSNYKIRIYDALLNNDTARNGTYNIMHQTYKIDNDSDISFDEFMNKDITLYRGGDISDDVFTSFTMKKSIADGFMNESKTDKMTEITVKPIEILGMCQPTGEEEVLVPKNVLDNILNKSEKDNDKIISFDKYLAALRYPDDTKGD